MIDDIIIPPEALEEMLRSFGCECPSCQKAMKRVGLAMLKNWPGMLMEWNTRARGKSEEIILPLTQENTNAKA